MGGPAEATVRLQKERGVQPFVQFVPAAQFPPDARAAAGVVVVVDVVVSSFVSSVPLVSGVSLVSVSVSLASSSLESLPPSADELLPLAPWLPDAPDPLDPPDPPLDVTVPLFVKVPP